MKRLDYFDNARAILIYLVVVGHMLAKFVEDNHVMASIYLFIYTFHMPAFILISGFFAKKVYQPDYIPSLVKKLLLPYVIFQVLYSLYYYYVFGDKISFSLFIPRWALWFLLSLIFWNILLYFLGKLKYGLPLSILFSLIIGYDAHVGEFLTLERTFFFFPFFMMGYYLEQKHFVKLKTSFHILIGFTLSILIFSLIYFYVPIDQRAWLLGKRSYAEMSTLTMEFAWLGRLCAYVVMAVATYTFLTLVPKRHLFFTSIGKVTLTVYLLHMALVRIFYDSSLKEFISTSHQYWLIFVVAFLIVLVVSRQPVINLVNKLNIKK